MRSFKDRVTVDDGNLFFIFETKVYESDQFVAGYYSRVDDLGHVLMCDIDTGFKIGKPRLKLLGLTLARKIKAPDLIVIKSAKGYHVLTTGVYGPEVMSTFYDIVGRACAGWFKEDCTVDFRHLASGYLRDPVEWTLRFSPKVDGEPPFSLIYEEVFPATGTYNFSGLYSETHRAFLQWYLRRKFNRRPFATPYACKLPLGVYRL